MEYVPRDLDELPEIFEESTPEAIVPPEINCYPFKPNARKLLGFCLTKGCYDQPCRDPNHRREF